MFAGCGCLFLMLLSGTVGILIAVFRRPGSNYQRLMALLRDFVMGGARGQAEVDTIYALLLNYFVKDEDYGALIAAVGSFRPGASPPYRDGAALAEVFRLFLRSRNVSMPDAPAETENIWPPPPNFNITRQSDRNEN